MPLKYSIAQFAELKWWQHYLKHKPVEEYLTWKMAYWHKIFTLCKPHINITPMQTMLDAGCGPAGIFIYLCKSNFSVIAADPLLDDYENKLPHFARSKYPDVQFINCGLEELKLTTPCYTSFCLNAINHVRNINAAMDSLAAATSNQIILSIDAHNYKGLKHIFRALPGDILHPHQYDVAEYTKMLTQRGFAIKASVLVKRELIFSHIILVAERRY
jgi:2-polyprenyl-3-methyl-5-hydroxy-6-metoxy-1,4-benzoquinol methylase